MPDQRRIFQIVFLEECEDIVGEDSVVVRLVLGGIAVVSEVEGVDGTREGARKGAEGCVSVSRVCDQNVEGRDEPYLLTLRLFFLLPKRPWSMMIGSPLDFPCSS